MKYLDSLFQIKKNRRFNVYRLWKFHGITAGLSPRKTFPIPAASKLGSAHDHPIHDYSRSSCTLNSTASLMPLFVSPPSCLGDPSTPVYIPATHFAFRPKLIGLRIGRLELFILCPTINQFLRRPNRGRKDRTATRATKPRTTSEL